MKREREIANIRDLFNDYKIQNGLSNVSLAEKIGMNDSSLQIILSGKRNITLEMVDFAYLTFGESALNSISSNEYEEKMIKEYLNPITRNEERLLVKKYCRDNNITIEQIAKEHGITPSVLSRMLTREFSANLEFYPILKNLGLEKELEEILSSRKDLIENLKEVKNLSKSEGIFLYNSLLLSKALQSENKYKLPQSAKKEKAPAIRNKIGNLGHDLRKKNSLSFKDMSKLLNCSPSSIQSMESSKIPFNIDYYNLLVKYGYQLELEKEMDKLKEEIFELKSKEKLSQEDKIKIKSYRNYIEKEKISSNKRPVNAKRLLSLLEESLMINDLNISTSLKEKSKEVNIPLSSIHKILQKKQVADERFYQLLCKNGYKKELLELSKKREKRFLEIRQIIDNHKEIFYKDRKEASYHKVSLSGDFDIKAVLSKEDYIFYKSYIALIKVLLN